MARFDELALRRFVGVNIRRICAMLLGHAHRIDCAHPWSQGK
jgi:hypothetical protein